MPPGCNANRKEKRVAGKITKLQAEDVHADGNELPDGERRSTHSKSAHQPPSASWNRRSLSIPFCQRRSEDGAPRTITETEDQQCLRKPQRAVDDFLVLPDPANGRPETVGLRKVPNPRGKRSKDQDECEQRHAEPQKPVADEARKAFALERSRSEITGQQEEEAHEIGLVGGAEEHEQNARRRAGRLNLAPEPAADRAVRNRRMVKDYQCDHHRAETVDIKFAPRHESLYAGAGMRGSGSKPQKAARSLSLRAVSY